jgi:hypothetical protein
MRSGILWALCVSAPIFGVSAQAQVNDHTSAPAATTSPKTAATVGSARISGDSSSISKTGALRYESSWGSADIIRGADGPVLGTVGWFRDFDVAKLVETSPRAVAEAKNFQTSNFRGSLVSTLGAATMAIGIVVSANSSNNAASPILIIGGAGAVGWGLQHINRGYAALSKALWWYNRESAR